MKFPILLLSIFLIHSLSFSQTCKYDSVEFKFKVNSDTIKSLDVIDYKLSFTNKSKLKKEYISPWDEAHVLPIIEIKYEQENKWEKLPLSSYSYGQYIAGEWGRGIIELASNETMVANSSWIAVPFSRVGVWLEHNHRWDVVDYSAYFKRLGKYKVRAAIYDCLDKKIEFYSNEEELIVIPYQGIDKEAYNWLEKNVPYPASVYIGNMYQGQVFSYYASTCYRMTGVKSEEKFLEFIQKFPSSSFAPWLELYLSKWYLSGFIYEIPKYDNSIMVIRKRPPSLIRVEKSEELLKNIHDIAIKNKDDLLLKYVIEQKNYIKANKHIWIADHYLQKQRNSNNNK